MTTLLAALAPEDEELVVALGDFDARREDPRTARGTGASPRPVSSLFDLVHLEADVEFECLEHLLVPSANGVSAYQSRRMLRHEDRFATVERENLLEVVGAKAREGAGELRPRHHAALGELPQRHRNVGRDDCQSGPDGGLRHRRSRGTTNQP